jgi:hypothetical protein
MATPKQGRPDHRKSQRDQQGARGRLVSRVLLLDHDRPAILGIQRLASHSPFVFKFLRSTTSH